MDILILSCGTGGGHNAAARAMEYTLSSRGHRVRLLNPYSLSSARLEHWIDSSYTQTASLAPNFFGAVYAIGNAYRRLPCRSPVYFIQAPMAQLLSRDLEEHPADVILTTHPFPAEILTQMKNRGMPVPKVLYIATDYVCTPFTEETDCDFYIIPAPDLRYDFIRRGIPESRILPFGIPVNAGFSSRIEKEQACRILELDPDIPRILILGGSFGAGALPEILSSLSEDQSIQHSHKVVICGSSQALLHKLKNLSDKNTTLVGYTDLMAYYMASSDIVVTKPGGLTTTEAAIMGKPLIHTSPIPGCETLNQAYFADHGMSLAADPTSHDLLFAIHSASRPLIASAMRHAQKVCLPRHAAETISNFVETL